MACALPAPQLRAAAFDEIPVLTDDALASSVGVRVLFTQRAGGTSSGPYESLNLGTHVDDDPDAVAANRARLARSVGADPGLVVVPNQVHGTDLVVVSDGDAASVSAAREEAARGADALVVEAPGVSALLCFADCTPVVVVSPTGRFAVAHAGWRGALAGIAGKAVRALCALDEAAGHVGTAGGMNVYIGPHIHVECFETGEDVCESFARAFGEECASDRHVSLARAVSRDVVAAGVDADRIAVAPFCTKCNPDTYFSYRASGGVCGRHGAFAVRL